MAEIALDTKKKTVESRKTLFDGYIWVSQIIVDDYNASGIVGCYLDLTNQIEAADQIKFDYNTEYEIGYYSAYDNYIPHAKFCINGNIHYPLSVGKENDLYLSNGTSGTIGYAKIVGVINYNDESTSQEKALFCLQLDNPKAYNALLSNKAKIGWYDKHCILYEIVKGEE